jgi:hypothetical protein
MEAEDFDAGASGTAYYDTTLGNQYPVQYRTSNVDIASTSDSHGRYHVGHSRPGEWLRYTLQIPSAGTYEVRMRIATNTNTRTIRLRVNSAAASAPIPLPNTGGWTVYRTVNVGTLTLGAGTQVIRISTDTGYVDFNYFDLVPVSATSPVPPATTAKPNLIFDTDFAIDCDDAGALAVLHALADKGEVNIVGVMISTGSEYAAPGVDAVNTFYGRPNIPIGTLKNSTLAVTGNWWRHNVYNEPLAKEFPNDLRDGDNAPNATTLYRQLLAKAADQSITILTVGPLINLSKLLASPADAISPLNGRDLVKKKVKLLVTAGGVLPSGTSYNFTLDKASAYTVINTWPTAYAFAPNELGGPVVIGQKLLDVLPRTNPIRRAFELFRLEHPTQPFRQSWDQAGVLVAVRGTAGLFKTQTTGSVVADTNGNVKWVTTDKNHIWYQSNSTVAERAAVIEALMLKAPAY